MAQQGGGQTQAVGQQMVPSSVVPPPPSGLAQPWQPTPPLSLTGVPLAPAQLTNRWSTASVVLGALSYLGHVVPVVGGATLAIAAIIAGFVARSQIRRTGESGSGAALVGIGLGAANLILTLVIVVLVLLVIGLGFLDEMLHR